MYKDCTYLKDYLRINVIHIIIHLKLKKINNGDTYTYK